MHGVVGGATWMSLHGCMYHEFHPLETTVCTPPTGHQPNSQFYTRSFLAKIENRLILYMLLKSPPKGSEKSNQLLNFKKQERLDSAPFNSFLNTAHRSIISAQLTISQSI